MQQQKLAKPPKNPEQAPMKGASNHVCTPLEERLHVFEERHWVNEACGDDLWKT